MQSNVLGENIKTARKRKRYSAEKLGELLDPPVTYAAVYAWEKGKNEPSVAYILQMCELLDSTIYEFIDLPQREDADASDEVAECMSRMTDTQRDAVLRVARAMVEC